MYSRLLVLLCAVVYSQAASSLLTNRNFETTTYDGNWYCQGDCTLTPSTDSYTGQHSVLVSGRTESWNGIAQAIDVKPGHVYNFTSMVQLISPAGGAQYEDFGFTLACKAADGSEQYRRIGRTPYVTPGSWNALGGVIRIEEGFSDCRVYIETDAPVDYLVDTVTVEEVVEKTDIIAEAQEQITENRMSNISVRVNVKGCKKSEYTVEINQTSNPFGVGSAVKAEQIVDPAYQAYQDVFYDNFQWGVIENKLKWRQSENQRGQHDYDAAVTALDALLANGVQTRCHNAFWSVEEFIPDWVKGLSGADLDAAISERIQALVGATSGKCMQWDVNNENMLNDFYERTTGNPNITMSMFEQMNAVDSAPALFLNEKDALVDTNLAMAIRDRALAYQAAGVPIGGIGIEAQATNFDLTLMKAGLDILSEAGIPIFVTAFAVLDSNAVTKAETMIDVLTLLYSYPSVQGVNLWGFWDALIYDKSAALYTGDNLKPNAAGLALEEFIHSRIMTNDLTSIGQKRNHYSLMGNQGTYDVTLKRNGEVIATQTMELGPNDKNIRIKVKKNCEVKMVIKDDKTA